MPKKTRPPSLGEGPPKNSEAYTTSPFGREVQQRAALIVSALNFEWPAGSSDASRDFFVSTWEATELSPERAIALAQDPLTLCLALVLRGVGLQAILADRHATAGLKRCLIENNSSVRRALATYASQNKPKGKPGPRPKDGKYLQEAIVGLDQQGMTDTQIAIAVYNDPDKRNLVAAHLTQARKRRARRPQQ